MSSKILLFDIDRTLLDTDNTSVLRNEALYKVLGSAADLQKIKLVKEEYRHTLTNEREYLPEDFLKLLCKKLNLTNYNSLLNIYYGGKYKHIYSGCVYPETFEVIEKLKNKFTFGIYSEGTDKFQNHKFQSMGISDYFDPNLIFIVPAKDTSDVVSRLPKDAIIVDDKEKICEFLTENNIKAIWLNKNDDRNSEKFTTIHNLLDLLQVLY